LITVKVTEVDGGEMKTVLDLM